MSETLTGGCLCGDVGYECATEPAVVGHCHCEDCRRSSGTGHCTHVAFPEEAVTLSGEIRFYEKPADSGHLVRRGFCPVCGSPVYSTNSAMPGLLFVRASSLDDPERVTPMMIVYASRAPSWDSMDPALPTHAEMPNADPSHPGP